MRHANTTIVQEESIQNRCSVCNNSDLVFDPVSCEMICSSCGIVVQEAKEVCLNPELTMHFADDLEGKTRTGGPSSLAIHDMGLSTSIPYANMDGKGIAMTGKQRGDMYRLRRLDRSSPNDRTRQRSLKSAFLILGTIKHKLSLPDSAVETSAYNFRKALDHDMIRGRSVKGVVVASTYAACRALNVPRRLDEIAEAADADRTFVAKCYRLLVRELQMSLPKVEPDRYLVKIAKGTGVREKTYRRALDIMHIVKKSHVSEGKDPKTLAVAAFYKACIEEKENVTQLRVADAANVSIVSLRKRMSDVDMVCCK